MELKRDSLIALHLAGNSQPLASRVGRCFCIGFRDYMIAYAKLIELNS